MALDGKTIIKEEITDKDAYEASASANTTRRTKGEFKILRLVKAIALNIDLLKYKLN